MAGNGHTGENPAGGKPHKSPLLAACATAAARDGNPVFVRMFPTCR